jgi:hypothetical protein
MQLDRVGRHRHRRIRAKKLRPRREGSRLVVVRVSALDGAMEQTARRLDARRHVRDHAANKLKARHNRIELLALRRIDDRLVQRACAIPSACAATSGRVYVSVYII